MLHIERRLEHKRVLLAEDIRVQRRCISDMLKVWDYEVLEANDGQAALEIVARESPRIVITDLDMPRLSGYELLRTIRRDEFVYTYVIVVSSPEGRDRMLKALELGADDYLTKPFTSEELKIRLMAADRILRLQSQEKLMLAMARLADYRSEETGFHLERVQHFARALALRLDKDAFPDVTPAFLSHLFSLSCLHDIGKVAIPDSILHKPGRLNANEFEIMKQHASIGGKLLRDLHEETGSEFIHMAKEIVLYHHERYNGGGYPHGVKGEDIPLAARLVAVADVYDALSSERCYKSAYPREKCRKIILEERGEHFDPRLVDAFERCEDEFWKIKTRFEDEIKPKC